MIFDRTTEDPEEENEKEEEEEEEKKEESETIKSLKKGAGFVGGLFKKGWGAVKSGASKANEKFKETEVMRCERAVIYSSVRRRLLRSTSSSRPSSLRRLLKEVVRLVLL